MKTKTKISRPAPELDPITRTWVQRAAACIAHVINLYDFQRCLFAFAVFLSWAWRVACLVIASFLVFGTAGLSVWIYLLALVLMHWGDPMRPLLALLKKS